MEHAGSVEAPGSSLALGTSTWMSLYGNPVTGAVVAAKSRGISVAQASALTPFCCSEAMR